MNPDNNNQNLAGAAPPADNPVVPNSQPAVATPPAPTASPATLTPQEVVSAQTQIGVAPAPQPMPEAPAPAAVAPSVASQPAPVYSSSMMGKQSGLKSKKMKMILIPAALVVLVGAVVALLFVFGVIGGNSQKIKSLSSDKIGNVSFKRPSDWLKVEEEITSSAIAYSNDGKLLLNGEGASTFAGMIAGGEDIPGYNTLSEAEKSLTLETLKSESIKDAMVSQFTSSLDCADNETPESKELTVDGSDYAFEINGQCTQDGEVGRFAFRLVLFKDGTMGLIAFVALDDAYKTNATKIDEIMSSLSIE